VFRGFGDQSLNTFNTPNMSGHQPCFSDGDVVREMGKGSTGKGVVREKGMGTYVNMYKSYSASMVLIASQHIGMAMTCKSAATFTFLLSLCQ
jgi:hypothetical protein